MNINDANYGELLLTHGIHTSFRIAMQHPACCAILSVLLSAEEL